MLHTMLQRHGSRQPRLAAGTARALPTAHCADPAERSAAVACLPSSPPSPRLAGTAESRSLKCNRAEQASAAGRLVRGRRTGVDLRGGGRVHPQEAQLALAGRVARRGGHLVLQLALRLVALPQRRNPPLAGRPQDERTYTQAAAARLVRFLGTVLSAVLRYMASVECGSGLQRLWPPAPRVHVPWHRRHRQAPRGRHGRRGRRARAPWARPPGTWGASGRRISAAARACCAPSCARRRCSSAARARACGGTLAGRRAPDAGVSIRLP